MWDTKINDPRTIENEYFLENCLNKPGLSSVLIRIKLFLLKKISDLFPTVEPRLTETHDVTLYQPRKKRLEVLFLHQFNVQKQKENSQMTVFTLRIFFLDLEFLIDDHVQVLAFRTTPESFFCFTKMRFGAFLINSVQFFETWISQSASLLKVDTSKLIKRKINPDRGANIKKQPRQAWQWKSSEKTGIPHTIILQKNQTDTLLQA